MLLTIFGVISLTIIYLIGKFFNKNMIGPIIISILIGLNFEIQVAPMFIYNTEKLNYYFIAYDRAIPISIIIAWSCALCSCILIIEIIQKIKSEKINISKYFLYGLVVIAVTGVPLEFIGYNTGLWTYTYAENIIKIMGVPWPAILGWFFFGTVFLSTIKLYENNLNEKIIKSG